MSDKYIICIDDEQIVLNSLNKQISDKFGGEFFVELAESGEEALELFTDLKEEGYEVVMFISDQIMPGMKGDELLTTIQQQDQDIIKILLTGQADLEATVNAINNANLFRYIAKPWNKEDLLLTIDKGLHQYYLVNKLADQVNTFAKFVPKPFLEHLSVKEYQDISLGLSSNKDLCTLFLDVRNFTTFSEQHTPKEVVTLLNTMFAKFAVIISQHHGFIDKYIGDAIMAIFAQQHTDQAVLASIGIIQALDQLKKDKILTDDINIGIGLGLGNVMIGTVGAEERIDTTVIGDSVNMSARIEGITKQYKAHLLVTDLVYEKLKDDSRFHIRLLDYIPIKGKADKKKVYEVFNVDTQEMIDIKNSGKHLYEEIIQLYIDGQPCQEQAKSYLKQYPQDVQAQIALESKIV